HASSATFTWQRASSFRCSRTNGPIRPSTRSTPGRIRPRRRFARSSRSRAKSSGACFNSPSVDPNVEKGGDVIVTRCLRLSRGDTLHLIAFNADDVAGVIVRAAERAGVKIERVEVDESPVTLAARLAGAKASILVAGSGLPGPAG